MLAKKILIIEDDRDIINLVKLILELEGFEVFVAFDGQEGWEKIESLCPNLILLDIRLPKLDGFQVIERLKSNRATSRIPIVILTASAQKESIARGLAAGADTYITKPFEPAEMVQKIRQILKTEKGRGDE